MVDEATTWPVELTERIALVRPVNARLVVVALVVVPLRTKRPVMVDDELTYSPRVEVGARAPNELIENSLNRESQYCSDVVAQSCEGVA